MRNRQLLNRYTNLCKKIVLPLFLLLVFAFTVSAADIEDQLHLNIQVTNSSGSILTGTYNFTFNITTASDCTGVIYSNTTEQTTDDRGVISYYLENTNLDFDQQYYLCYYRDGDLKSASSIARSPYSFDAKNVSASGVKDDSNLNLATHNITADFGFLNISWNRIYDKPANLDTDSTDDLTTGTSWGGDLDGTGANPTIATDSIGPDELDDQDTPNDNEILAYDSGTGRLYWKADDTGSGSDDQTLSWNPSTHVISIESGNTIDISSLDTTLSSAEVLAIVDANGYWSTSNFTLSQTQNWDEAYGWGNHAAQNYLDMDTYPNVDTNASDDFDGAYSSLTGAPDLSVYNNTYTHLSNFTDDIGVSADYDSLTDFTTTLTDTYLCRYDLGGGVINCDVDPSTLGGNSSAEIVAAVDAAYPNLDTDSTDDFDGAWGSLTGVPAGFSDGVDNDTQLSESQVDAYADNNNYVDLDTYPNADTDSTDDLTTGTTLGGDVSGTYNNLQLGSEVVNEDNLNVSNSPTTGQVLAYNTTSGRFYWVSAAADTTCDGGSCDIANTGTLDGYEASALLDNTDNQTLSYSGGNITISGGNSVNISGVDTVLSEATVDSYADNNNYLDLDTYPNADTDSTDDFDGAYGSLTGAPDLSVYNNTYTHLSNFTDDIGVAADYDALTDFTNGLNNGQLCRYTSGTGTIDCDVDYSGWDTNAADDFDGAWGSLTGVPAGFSDGVDNDTQLTESQVDAFADNNNYLDLDTYPDADTDSTDDFSGAYADLTGKPDLSLYNNTYTHLSNFTDDIGVSADYDSLSDLQAAVSNDFHNLGGSETDPVFGAAAAAAITNTNITNWNTAYGWGDHSTQNYLDLDSATDKIGDNEINYSQVTLSDFTNDLGFVQSNTNVEFLNVTINGMPFVKLSQNANIDGEVFGILMTNPPNGDLPHFWVQSGGSSQASGVARSFMIVNEYVPLLNSTDRTDCAAWAAYYGEDLKIDCNTTTTGADLFVGDDMQVNGDVWIQDENNKWHSMNQELDILDAFFEDVVLATTNVTWTNNNLTIASLEPDGLIDINLNTVKQRIAGSTVSFVNGTNTTPKDNYLYYKNDGGTYSLVNTETDPIDLGLDHAMVWTGVVGDVGNFYAAIPTVNSQEHVVTHLFQLALNRFDRYESGFSVTSAATNLNYTSGSYWVGLSKLTTTNNLAIATDGFYWVKADGTFEQCTALTCIEAYNDGGAIGVNKYFLAIVGVIQDSETTARLVIIPQNNPGTEHTNAVDAETDGAGYLSFSNADDIISKNMLRLSKVILQQGDTQFQAFSNGNYQQSIVGLTLAGAAAAGTNDHGQLTGLGDDDHPQYGALAQDETVSGTWTFSNTISGSIDGNAATATSATNWDGETSQADLNVNSSNYWDGYDTPSGWDLDASDDFTDISNFTGTLTNGYLCTYNSGSGEIDCNNNPSTYLDNTDSQTLSYSGGNITISGGNSVNISGVDTVLSEATVDSYADNNNYLDLDTYPNADTDSTDDFDGAFGSLTGVPSDLADGDNDTTYTHLSNFTDDIGVSADYDSISDFSTTTNVGQLCRYTSASEIDCDIDYSGWDTNSGDDFDGAWSSLSGVPAGFSDGVDNDTTYTHLSNFTDDIGVSADYDAITDFTGTITDTYLCRYNSTGGTIDCDVDPSSLGGTSNPFDQSLNTTDDVTHAGLTVDHILISSSDEYITSESGVGFGDGSDLKIYPGAGGSELGAGGDLRLYTQTGGSGFGDVIIAYNGSSITGKVGIGQAPSGTYFVEIAGDLYATQLLSDDWTNVTITESQISDLDHFTGADITGSETAFDGWDKNSGDDFDGAYSSLSGAPTALSSFTDDLGDRGYTSLSNFTNDPGYFNNIANVTGTLTNTYLCTYNSGSGKIDCNTDPSSIGGDVVAGIQGQLLMNDSGATGAANVYTISSIAELQAAVADQSHTTKYIYLTTTLSQASLTTFSSYGYNHIYGTFVLGDYGMTINAASGSTSMLFHDSVLVNDDQTFTVTVAQNVRLYLAGASRDYIGSAPTITWTTGSAPSFIYYSWMDEDISLTGLTHYVWNGPLPNTGADLYMVTGTAGTNGNVAVWNTDGDIVDGGALPTAVSDLSNDIGFFSDIGNFTGTLTNTYVCTYNSGSGEIDCNTDPASLDTVLDETAVEAYVFDDDNDADLLTSGNLTTTALNRVCNAAQTVCWKTYVDASGNLITEQE